MHRSDAYRDTEALRGVGALPISERMADEVLSLPVGPHLSDDRVETVITAIHDAMARCT